MSIFFSFAKEINCQQWASIRIFFVDHNGFNAVVEKAGVAHHAAPVVAHAPVVHAAPLVAHAPAVLAAPAYHAGAYHAPAYHGLY